MSGRPLYPWTRKDSNDTTRSSDSFSSQLRVRLQEMSPRMMALTTFLLGAATAVTGRLVYKRYGRRIRNSEWVTPQHLTRKRWLKGIVTSVGDADNFRFFHTPPFGGILWPFKYRSDMPNLTKDLKDETIHVRIAGVDAPEAAHFGRPAQPYSAESLAWLRNTILGKKVYIQPLRKDQYARIVAQVYLAPRILPGFLFYGKNIPAEMLKAGWAVTYEQTGAEYGTLGKDGYLRLEAQAKAAHKGMWKDGAPAETPAEYKRRHASAASLQEAESARPVATRKKKQKSWLGRLFPW